MRVAFEKLYEKYHRDLYNFIFYMIKDQHVTEDLVQEVYVRALQSIDHFRKESKEKTWLFSIARYATIDYIRSNQRKRKRIMEFFDWGEQGESIPDQLPLPEEITVQNEVVQKVYHYLDKCTVDQRSVLILRFIHSLSIQETAEVLNFTVSKVKTTQHRALKVIRKHFLEDESKGGTEL